jgi:hypothetical protein
MNDVMKALLQEEPLDPSSEAHLCHELAATHNRIEAMKLSQQHEVLLEMIEKRLEEPDGRFIWWDL